MERGKVPIVGQVAAGRPVEFVQAQGTRDIRSVPGFKPHEIAAIQIVGDSLERDNIVDGDWAVFQHAYQANEGELVIALTPDGLTVKYYFPLRNGAVLLRAAHPAFDQHWEAREVSVQGRVLRIERDISSVRLFGS